MSELLTQGTAIGTVLGFVIGVLIPFIFAMLLPNEKFYGWGFKHGKKLDSFMSGKVGNSNWEALENNITGSFFAYAQGLKEGADLDDTVEPEVKKTK